MSAADSSGPVTTGLASMCFPNEAAGRGPAGGADAPVDAAGDIFARVKHAPPTKFAAKSVRWSDVPLSPGALVSPCPLASPGSGGSPHTVTPCVRSPCDTPSYWGTPDQHLPSSCLQAYQAMHGGSKDAKHTSDQGTWSHVNPQASWLASLRTPHTSVVNLPSDFSNLCRLLDPLPELEEPHFFEFEKPPCPHVG